MKSKKFVLIIILLIIMSACNKPDIIVYNKKLLKSIKVIKFDKIEINSLNFDPYIKNDIKNLIEFELNKSGYKVERSISTNQPVEYDAKLNFYLSHRKFFKGVDETENITIDLKLIDKSKKKICSIFFTDIEDDDLLNSVKLKEYISEIINKIKESK